VVNLGPLLFLLYINDLPNIITNESTSILFADDTSIIITNYSPIDYENNLTKIQILMNGLRLIY
jgi:hypothetical protein